jgi:DNA topoisomerase I
VRDGRFGPFIQRGEAEGEEKPKRASIPKGTPPSSVDLDKALKLLALPREVARHPETGQPILANIGRYGPYVQHGKTYATLGRDDDVLEVGGNRAIDLIVAKESGAAGGGRRSDPGRPLGEDPASGQSIVVKAGRYGPYVTDGSVNATLPREMAPDAVTLDEAVGLLNARRASGGGKSKRRAPGRAAKGGKGSSAGAKKAASTKKAAAAKKSAAKKAPARKKAAE